MSSTSVRLRPHSSQACFSARSVSNPISAGATMSSFASAGKQRFGSEEQPTGCQATYILKLQKSSTDIWLRTAGEEVDVVRREPDEGVAEADALPPPFRHRPVAAIHHLLRAEGADEGVRRAGLRHRPLHTSRATSLRSSEASGVGSDVQAESSKNQNQNKQRSHGVEVEVVQAGERADRLNHVVHVEAPASTAPSG